MQSRKILFVAAMAVSWSAVSCHKTAGIAGPPSEILKLGQLVGKWQSTSHSLAGSLQGKTEDVDRSFECAWTLDKYYLTCVQVAEVNGKKVKEVDLFTYQENTKLYSMTIVADFGDDPPRIYTNWFAWDKDTWRFLPKDGIRSTWVFKTPDYHTTLTERSRDGVSWSEVVKGEHHRVF